MEKKFKAGKSQFNFHGLGNAAPPWVLPAGKFLLGFGLLVILFSALLQAIALQWAEEFYARGTMLALALLGIKSETIIGEPVLMNIAGVASPIGITYLCTGLLEMAIIAAAVLASFGISLKKRAIGAAIGILAAMLFNFARIISSILIIIFMGLDAGDFAHGILFKIALFVTIAGYYRLWFGWATADRSAARPALRSPPVGAR